MLKADFDKSSSFDEVVKHLVVLNAETKPESYEQNLEKHDKDENEKINMQSLEEIEEHYRHQINVTVDKEEKIMTLDIVQIGSQ